MLRLLPFPYDFASVRYTYDDAGNKHSEYYDAEGNMTTCSKGYASIVYVYDENGNNIE